MKTYREFITEIESIHSSYGRWGTMDDDGDIEDGLEHHSAMVHADLPKHNIAWAHEHPIEQHDSSWGDNLGWEPHNKVKLNIRTRKKSGLAAAIENFGQFPHVASRLVDWEHTMDGKISGHFGDKVSVLNRMKAHYEKHYGKLEDK